MQIIFRTPFLPGAQGRRPDGTVAEGAAVFTLRSWVPSEVINSGFRPVRLGDWRREWGQSDGSVSFACPEIITVAGQVPPAAIVPAAVLDALPSETLIEGAWGIYRGKIT